uniref:Sulfotransferase domain-containing protein n=1 Tax=Ditylum brightwellii TaxID=49249 RepID=A0A7S4SWG4_9STRA
MSTAKEIINGTSADLNDSVNTLDARNSTHMDVVVAHDLVFVHLGKTAGSSITCMLDPSIHHSGYGNSQCSNDNKFLPSAISQHVVERVHLKPAPINTHDNFLITVRNPLDRIVSWFYYLHPSFPPAKSNRHKLGCDNFKVFNCWDNIQSLSEEGLDSSHNYAANGKIIDYFRNSSKIISTSNYHHYANQTVEECRAWA